MCVCCSVLLNLCLCVCLFNLCLCLPDSRGGSWIVIPYYPGSTIVRRAPALTLYKCVFLSLSPPLFLASTASAMHRNAHIWNATHPLLVTCYCWVDVYSPSMKAKKIKVKTTWQIPGVEQTSLGISKYASVHYANCEIEPDGSYFLFVKCRRVLHLHDMRIVQVDLTSQLDKL